MFKKFAKTTIKKMWIKLHRKKNEEWNCKKNINLKNYLKKLAIKKSDN